MICWNSDLGAFFYQDRKNNQSDAGVELRALRDRGVCRKIGCKAYESGNEVRF